MIDEFRHAPLAVRIALSTLAMGLLFIGFALWIAT